MYVEVVYVKKIFSLFLLVSLGALVLLSGCGATNRSEPKNILDDYYKDCHFTNKEPGFYVDDPADGNFDRKIVTDPDLKADCLELYVKKDQTSWTTIVKLNDRVPCQAGKKYKLSLRYKVLYCLESTPDGTSETSRGQLGIWSHCHNAAGASLPKEYHDIDGDYHDLVFWSNGRTDFGEWKTIEKIDTTPANTAYRNFDIGTGSVRAGTKFHIDWIKLEKVD